MQRNKRTENLPYTQNQTIPLSREEIKKKILDKLNSFKMNHKSIVKEIEANFGSFDACVRDLKSHKLQLTKQKSKNGRLYVTLVDELTGNILYPKRRGRRPSKKPTSFQEINFRIERFPNDAAPQREKKEMEVLEVEEEWVLSPYQQYALSSKLPTKDTPPSPKKRKTTRTTMEVLGAEEEWVLSPYQQYALSSKLPTKVTPPPPKKQKTTRTTFEYPSEEMMTGKPSQQAVLPAAPKSSTWNSKPPARVSTTGIFALTASIPEPTPNYTEIPDSYPPRVDDNISGEKDDDPFENPFLTNTWCPGWPW